MQYTGVLQPGGPPQSRTLEELEITKLSVGWLDNNAYLLRCRQTGEQVLIDAADEASLLLSAIGQSGLAAVITTHSHDDHWLALADVVAATGTRSYAGEADAPMLPVPTTGLRDGGVIAVGRFRLEIIHLRGHTDGSIAVLYNDPSPNKHAHLFTGDSLFPGGVGNTFGDRKAFETLVSDIQRKVFDKLADDTWIYPGHGADTTVGTEREHAPLWLERGW